jgi:LysR family transcriptional regulator for bpeEF and oprC
MDRFAVMATFIRVAERGSFTHAADDLGISRAQASQQVAALEKRLGVRLFDRTTRRVALSNHGAEYLERARRIMADVAQADEAMSRTRERPHGRLRVDVPVAFGRNLLVPALPQFRKRYPELKLELRFNDRLVDLLAEKVDIALRFGPVRDGRLIARRLFASRWITCAAPSYVAAHGAPLQPQGLAGHQCIGYLAPESGRVREWQFGKGKAHLRQRVECVLAFDSAEAVLASGIAGGGVFQASHLLASGPMAAGLLQQLLVDYAVDGPVGSIVYPGSARHSAAVRVFGDFLAGLMREHADKVETVAGRARSAA